MGHVSLFYCTKSLLLNISTYVSPQKRLIFDLLSYRLVMFGGISGFH